MVGFERALLGVLDTAEGWIIQLVCYVPYGGGGDLPGTILGLFILTRIWMDIPASLLATHTCMLMHGLVQLALDALSDWADPMLPLILLKNCYVN